MFSSQIQEYPFNRQFILRFNGLNIIPIEANYILKIKIMLC